MLCIDARMHTIFTCLDINKHVKAMMLCMKSCNIGAQWQLHMLPFEGIHKLVEVKPFV